MEVECIDAAGAKRLEAAAQLNSIVVAGTP